MTHKHTTHLVQAGCEYAAVVHHQARHTVEMWPHASWNTCPARPVALGFASGAGSQTIPEIALSEVSTQADAVFVYDTRTT